MTSPLPESIVLDVETLDLRRRQYAHIAELLEELTGTPNGARTCCRSTNW